MTTKKIYGPWIKWHGRECPVPDGAEAAVKFRTGGTGVAHPANSLRWFHIEGGGSGRLMPGPRRAKTLMEN